MTANDAREVKVRRAGVKDAPTLVSLICELADYENLPRPDQGAIARLVEHGFGARPRFEVYLAELGARAVGYTITFETYSTFLARPTLFLEDLFVLPDYRKLGAGMALFLNCVRLAKERDCGRMEWMVLDWNALAIDFYKRLGANHLQEWQLYRLTSDDLVRLAQAE